MSDAPSKPGVPSWQLAPIRPDTSTTPAPATSTTPTTTTQASEEKLQTARKWLDAEGVRDKPLDEQVSFLEGKGLGSKAIERLLGVSRNMAASGNGEEKAVIESKQTSSETSPQRTPTPQQQQQTHPAPVSATQTSTPPPTTTPLAQAKLAEISPYPPRSFPPVITYPEFLTKPTAPSPLITMARLRATLYLFASISALVYGTSAYLIAPMAVRLTSARHEFAQTAVANLARLIERLRSCVSVVPEAVTSGNAGVVATPYADRRTAGNDSDSDSDPTELFHRDIGVQTSLPPSPRLESSTAASVTPAPVASVVEKQTASLKGLISDIKQLNAASAEEGTDFVSLRVTVDMVREQLSSLAYVPPAYMYGSGYNGVGGTGSANEKKDDEIERLKASIRSVKGVLLGARTFPGGNGVRAGGR